jgi:hypothetical protein
MFYVFSTGMLVSIDMLHVVTKNTTMAGTEPACSAAEKTATDLSGVDADKGANSAHWAFLSDARIIESGVGLEEKNMTKQSHLTQWLCRRIRLASLLRCGDQEGGPWLLMQGVLRWCSHAGNESADPRHCNLAEWQMHYHNHGCALATIVSIVKEEHTSTEMRSPVEIEGKMPVKIMTW